MLARFKVLPIILFAGFLGLQGCGGSGSGSGSGIVPEPDPSSPIGNTDGGTADGGTTDGGTTDGGTTDGGTTDGGTTDGGTTDGGTTDGGTTDGGTTDGGTTDGGTTDGGTTTSTASVFDGGLVDTAWDNGINAFDSAIGWGECNEDGGAGCPSIGWTVVVDSDRGDVLQISHTADAAPAGLFIGSSTGQDLSGFAGGTVSFDINVVSGDSKMTMKIDCGWPCTSGDQALGSQGASGWETVTVAVDTLVSGGLDLSAVNTGFVIWATDATSTIFEIDNVRWESLPEGGSTDGTTDGGTTDGTTDGSTDGATGTPSDNVTAADILGNPEYLAVSYGGYRGISRTNGPSIAEIKEDLRLMSAMGIKVLRTYNTQGFPFALNTLKAIKQLKAADSSFEMYVMLGAWMECQGAWTGSPNHSLGNSVTNPKEIAAAVAMVNEYPDIVKIIAVGNEAMVKWAATYYVVPSVILEQVNYLQGLKASGDIPADTWITSSDNFASWGGGGSEYHVADLTALINAVDFISMHTYPFHDTHYNPTFWKVPASEEGLTVQGQVDAAMVRAKDYAVSQYQAAASYVASHGGSGKPVHIGETGWSSEASWQYGNPGSNAADEYKEKLYFDLMRDWSNQNDISMFYFEAFDEPWKDASNSGGSENHFGLFTVDGEAKYALWDRVDEGTFDGLSRGGSPITKTFGGDVQALMATVFAPPLQTPSAGDGSGLGQTTTVNTERTAGQLVTESTYVVSDSSLVPTGSNDMTYPSSTLLVNAWEGTSALSLSTDGVVTVETGSSSGSWWGAGLEIEASSGENMSGFSGGTLVFDIKGDTTSKFNIGFQSGVYSRGDQVNNFVIFGPDLARSISSSWVTHEISVSEINKGANFADITSLLYFMGNANFDNKNIEVRNISYRK